MGQAHGKFDLHGIAQRILARPNQDIENLSQGKGVVLKHGGKRYDARSRPAHSIVDGVVIPGVRGSHSSECAVALGGIQAEPPLVPMPRTAGRSAIQLQGPEFRLRVGQYVFDRGKLHQVVGITRTESQTLPAIHHRPAQAESHGRDAILEGHGRHRIKIVRAHDSGEIRIKALPVGRAHNLLENHRHLFFFQTIRRRAHVGFRMAAEGGGVDAPNGLAQRQQSLVEVDLLVAQHEGLIYAGERLVLRILQKTGGAYRQRMVDLSEKRSKIVAEGTG